MTTKIVLDEFDREITFHKQASTSGMTNVVDSKEILKLFQSFSIHHHNIKLRMEHLKPVKGMPYTLKGDIRLEIELCP